MDTTEKKEGEMEKKETQTTIFASDILENKKATNEEFLTILRLVAPGTNLRAALNGIVDAKKGALILVENTMTNKILDGGFKVNCKFTPQRLIELSKMDGGIILSEDMKRIIHANVTLAPDVRIQTRETGTRHKAAERSAKMTGALAIAVSERKNNIHLYYKDIRYHLKDTSEVLRRATEILQILEKQRELFDSNIEKLNKMEINDDLSLKQACKVIQTGLAMQKILELHEKTLIELGNEASTLKLRIKEIMRDIERETDLVIKDYTSLNPKKSKALIECLSYEELLDLDNIIVALAHQESTHIETIEGWRLLSKTNLSEKEIADLLDQLKNFKGVLTANCETYKSLMEEEKSNTFSRELQRLVNMHK